MNELTLYTNPMSRGATADWMLCEIGKPYTTEVIEYGKQMKSPDYLAINPMGKIPALRHKSSEGEYIVTECAAICTYLAEKFPEAKLGPKSEESANYYRWLFFTAGPLEYAVLNQSIGVEMTPEMEGKAGYGNMQKVIEVLTNWLSNREYVCGDRFTAADVMLGAQIMWGLFSSTLPSEPPLTTYTERLAERKAFQSSALGCLVKS